MRTAAMNKISASPAATSSSSPGRCGSRGCGVRWPSLLGLDRNQPCTRAHPWTFRSSLRCDRETAPVHPRFKVPHWAELALGAVVAATADVRGAIGFSSFAVLGASVSAADRPRSTGTSRPSSRRAIVGERSINAATARCDHVSPNSSNASASAKKTSPPPPRRSRRDTAPPGQRWSPGD